MIFVVFVLILLIFALVKLCIWLWRKHSIGKAIAILIPVFLCSEIYFSIYPRNSFYEDEFVNISGEKLPTSSKVLAGYASYPDTHGDYTSCAIIEVSNSDYQYLKSLLVKELKAVEGGDVQFCSRSFTWESELNYGLSLSRFVDGGYSSTWGLIDNENLVYITYSSW